MANKPLAHIQFSHIHQSYSKNPVATGLRLFNKQKPTHFILNNTGIELKGGECILLTGKNGSGKSTLLRILAGLLKPDSAIVDTGFASLSWKKARKLLREQLMYLYQEPYMFDGTVRKNLAYAIEGTDKSQQINSALQWADLKHREKVEAKCLSGGEKQRLALAQAWLKQPRFLLLDEPMANMDKHAKRRTAKLLAEFKQAGTALLIATHDLDDLLPIMDKRLILVDGVILDARKENTRSDMTADNVTPFPKKLNR